MTSWRIKPEKTLISKTTAMKELALDENEFQHISILLNLKPAKPRKNLKYDSGYKHYYRISDIQNVYNHEAYQTFRKNRRLKNKGAINVIEQDYTVLVKHKFPTFREAIIGLSECLTILAMLREKELEIFKNITAKCLKSVFLTKKGIYYQMFIENVEVLWYTPHKFSAPPSEDTLRLLNDCHQLNLAHLRLINHKLTLLSKDRLSPPANTNLDLFSQISFCILNSELKKELEFIITSRNGSITEEATYYITDNTNIVLDINKVYIHFQFVFDCINQNKILDYEKYQIGKELPLHISPFDELNTIDEERICTLSKSKQKKLEQILNRDNLL
ncbi:Pescadillo like protein [Astathelohania contejeani]|uniref:Pescadillo like protein n=1 Tax=Astathelohania contejeani TaxID=164912 RepID=A0ABQ7I142_9MICR|nr:Pescadillo like protein [Thelohania contejeani]